MDRPLDFWIRDLKIGDGGGGGGGGNGGSWMKWKMYDYPDHPDDDEETLFCHRSGKFVKI